MPLPSSHDDKPSSLEPGHFATTHWSIVAAAGQTAPARAAEALERLCCLYWYPLYAYVRRRGHPPYDAQDLTQGFFAHLLARDFLKDVAREKGKFRSFLLASLNHFLSDEWDKLRAQKRGGGRKVISLDDETAEDRYRLEPVDRLDAEKIFARRWAMTLLEQVMARLEGEYGKAGNAGLFQQLQGVLLSDKGLTTYAEIAARLAMSEGAVKTAVHRMRHRYREIFRDEIANTVLHPGEIEDEMRHLIATISI